MAAITWRDVTAPDFSAAQEGFRQFSSLLNGAFGAANQGLERFDNTLDERAQRALAAAAQRYRDPAQLEAAMASGAIYDGIDQSRLDAEDYGSVDNALANRFGIVRTGLEIEGQTETNRSTKWTNARAETRAATMDRLGPHVAEAAAQAAAGNPEQAHQMMTRAIAAEGIEGLTPSELLALYTGGQEVASGEQRLRTGELQYDSSKFNYDQSVQSEAEKDAADAAWRRLATKAIDADGARELLFGDEFKDLPAAVFNTLLGRVDASFGSPGGSAGGAPAAPGGPSSVPAGGVPASSLYDTVLGNGQFGSPDVPFSQMTGRQAIDFGRRVLIPATRNNPQLQLAGTGMGSSAMGAYQFTGGTLEDFMPRVFKDEGGLDAVLTPERQERLAEAIFQSTGGSVSALRGRWQGLENVSEERVRAIGRMPWSQARQEIARVENGGRMPDYAPGASPTESRAAGILDAETRGLGNGNGLTGNSLALASGYMEAQQQASAGLRDVSAALTAENGRFAGVERARVEDELQYFMNKHDVSASVAAWALENGMRQRGIIDNARNIFRTNEAFAGRQIDRSASDQLISDALEGKLETETNQVQLMIGDQASRAAAEAAAATARANLQWAIRQNEIRNGAVDISRYREAVRVAEAALGAANVSRGTNPTLTPRRGEIPPARPARVSAPPRGEWYNRLDRPAAAPARAPARTPAPRRSRVDDFLVGSD